jgi:hypothetical protein
LQVESGVSTAQGSRSGKSGDLGAKPGREAGARPNKLGRTGSGLNHDSGGDGNGGTGSRNSGYWRKESAGRGGRKRRGGGPNQDESPDQRSGSRGRDPEENRGKERRHQATPARTRLEDRGGKKEDLHSAEENHRGHQQGNDGEADLSTGRPASGPRSAGRNPGGGKRHAYGGRPGKRGACVAGETAADGGHSREKHERTVSEEAGPATRGSGQGSWGGTTSEEGGPATNGAVGNRREKEGREENPGRSDQGGAATGGPNRGGAAPGGTDQGGKASGGGCQGGTDQPGGSDQRGAASGARPMGRTPKGGRR